MPTTWDPAVVSSELVALTRLLGEPHRDLAVLAEGNTSQLLDDGRLVVKASGANLLSATADDFVLVDVEEVMALVDSPTATQDDLTSLLVAGDTERAGGGGPRRGSIETVVHAAVHAAGRTLGTASTATFIGHTHPTSVVGILASTVAAQAWSQLVYSDEAVVIGRPLYVPYASPGLALGRVYAAALREYVATHGDLPQLVLLGNHGIVAIAPTVDGVEAVSTMAVKGARVRTIAYAVGGVAPLSDHDVTRFFARGDVAERRANLARGSVTSVPLPERIDVVFCDVGGPIYSDDNFTRAIRRALDEIRAERGRPPVDPAEFQLLYDQMRKAQSGGFRATLARELLGDVTLKRELHERTAPRWTHPEGTAYADALPMFRALHGPVITGVVANQEASTVEALRRDGFSDVIDVWGISALVGHEKPSHEFFDWALDQAGTTAEHAVHIGNRLDTDVRPARALGLGTIWVTRGEAPDHPTPEQIAQADVTVPDLTSVAALVLARAGAGRVG